MILLSFQTQKAVAEVEAIEDFSAFTCTPI
jgi:hypothetical protein